MPEETKPEGRPWGHWIPEEALEHLRAARRARRESMHSVLPPGFFEKHTEAKREMLLAARSFIDHALEHIETETKA